MRKVVLNGLHEQQKQQLNSVNQGGKFSPTKGDQKTKKI
jgi:hypothetical protein